MRALKLKSLEDCMMPRSTIIYVIIFIKVNCSAFELLIELKNINLPEGIITQKQNQISSIGESNDSIYFAGYGWDAGQLEIR